MRSGKVSNQEEDEVSPSTGPGNTGRTVSAVILGVIALVFIVVGIIYLAEPAGSLPSILGHETTLLHGKQVPSTGHRPLRAAGSLIVGVVFAVGAWFALKYKGRTVTPAGAASKEPAAR
jgi:multisubunit Na+/H+ antiporter MnhB subunit